MANIPGISGFIQPGAFARDRVLSRGVSIPGGVRIVCVMGEGLRQETVVASASGSGQDGSSEVSPTGSGDGRYFKLNNAPVISGRTELRLNGTLLFGKEEEIDDNSFDSGFDFRLDPVTGHFELQGASIADQDGKGYSAGSMNVGNGIIVENDGCSPILTLDILDDTAPAERWTVRCVSVVRDSNGDPIPGLATFTAIGSESGQLYDSSGNAIVFNSSYYTSGRGAVSGSEDAATDGFVVESGTDNGSVLISEDDESPETVSSFVVPGNLVAAGQAIPGDHLCVDGYIGIEIEDLEYNDNDLDPETTIRLVTDSLLTTTEWDEADTYDWEIRATNLLIDDPDILHDADGVPAEAGSFTSADIGKTVAVCQGSGGFPGGNYVVSKVTSSRRLRLHKLGDSSAGLPDMQEDPATPGIADDGLTFHMLQNNGLLLLGLQEGSIPFEVGDKFFVKVQSRSLAAGDTLEAEYVYEGDLNDPQLFTEANDLFTKHGFASEENTLSLGSQMVFENGAPAILALQCKPPVPRRTSVTLLERENSLGEGGFPACFESGDLQSNAEHCEVDDLRFLIPRPTTGLRNGKPDSDSRVNIFIVDRDTGDETQVFPNKVDFYQSQLESDIQQGNWIGSSDNSFSYTIVNASDDILENGDAGDIDEDNGGVYFTTPEVDFDASHVGMTIVVTSMDNVLTEATLTKSDDIAGELFQPGMGESIPDPELVISSIGDDSKVYVSHPDGGAVDPVASYTNVQFFIKDVSSNPDDALLLLHKDLVSSGVLKQGDGIRVSYVDENDADYFDTNWFNALEALEAAEAQIIVPLPSQAISSIFRATVNHCENMSSIANRKERVAFIGAQRGVTPDALTGRTEIAIEDIGILEGVQGDDPEEILDGNIEDLVNFKLSDNYTSNRCVYFYPDSIVRNVSGTNIPLHGFYMGAAAAGYLSAKQNVAIPLTNKTLSGFSLTRDKVYRPIILNQLGGVGATVLQPVTGGGVVLAGRTTSQSGYVEDEEISIIFIRDAVKKILRQSLKGYIGGVQSADTTALISARVGSIMSAMVSQGLATAYKNVRVEQDKVDPRQINVYLQFSPAYPINYVFIDIEVGVI
jgi:hypothetical protein